MNDPRQVPRVTIDVDVDVDGLRKQRDTLGAMLYGDDDRAPMIPKGHPYEYPMEMLLSLLNVLIYTADEAS